MEQQIAQNSEQDIKTVFDRFDYIKTKVNNEFEQISNGRIVLIFLGKFEQQFDTFYQHFIIKQVLLDTEYYKLIRIEKQGKISYLLNFPLILQYNQQDNLIQQNLCISKIYAEKAFQKMQKCKFHLIVDANQIFGQDTREKVIIISCDSVFQFGKYYFQENSFSLLIPSQDRWNLCKVTNQNEYNSRVVNYNEVLKNIFQINSYTSLKIIQSDDFLNYGKMMHYLKKNQDLLINLFNGLLSNFQKQLLFLQQMPIILCQDDTNQKVERYLKELEKDLLNIQNPLTHSFANMKKVFTLINKINKGNIALELNERIKRKNSIQMKQFLIDNNIQNIIIQPIFNDEFENKLNEILAFFDKYDISSQKINKITEFNNLKINLKFWCENCEQLIENTLYELKYIVKRIQEGPKNKIENGIYFIGVTKSGKSTIVNSIINPNKLQSKKILGQKCNLIQQGIQTKFKIDQGEISETQKISGIYTGQKEELTQFFNNQGNNEQEQDVISCEELLNVGFINQLPQNLFIFDCPGFDDNRNELMRIAHRISLYNYFHQTKNIIVFFVMDISNQKFEHIQNTFDPICCLLKNKNDIEQKFKSWTNLILTKAEINQRQEYLDDWEIAFRGQLEQNYSFYKKLFKDDETCLEFLKPAQDVNQDIFRLAKSITERVQKQLQQVECNPDFELILDEKLWMLYLKCMPKIQKRLEQIFQLFFSQIDQYILNSNENLEMIKEQMLRLKYCLLNQEQYKIIHGLDLNNCISILQKISQWIQGNQNIKEICFLLDAYINDIQSIFKISEYCKNTLILQFEVKIDKLVSKIETILKMIEETYNYYRNQQRFKSCAFNSIIIIVLLSGAYASVSSPFIQREISLILILMSSTLSLELFTLKQLFLFPQPELVIYLFKSKYKLYLQNEQEMENQ
ncbi:unnamed protein product [Paramecium pentaurelia]|uniref:Dynamin N-terminal domain-containing protein n=1 Tax=Paramecium pentaurelia TaxID=43138 RepID=A0A8S1Y068_9CILI|nr:unnamed protein product [Paramecium pentaurelia]